MLVCKCRHASKLRPWPNGFHCRSMLLAMVAKRLRAYCGSDANCHACRLGRGFAVRGLISSAPMVEELLPSAPDREIFRPIREKANPSSCFHRPEEESSCPTAAFRGSSPEPGAHERQIVIPEEFQPELSEPVLESVLPTPSSHEIQLCRCSTATNAICL